MLIVLLAFIAGTALRIDAYLTNSPVWGDTAKLAISIVEKNYLELFDELYHDQSAPVGFMVATKFISSFFNYSELSLYFIPVVSSICALALFILLSRELLGRIWAPIAFLPFAFNTSAIFYAGHFKQYSLEMCICIGILLTAYRVIKENFSSKAVTIYASVGIVSVWFSLTAIILLTGSGVALFCIALNNRSPRQLTTIVIGGMAVAVHFAALFLYQIRPAMPAFMDGYWAFAFPPTPFFSFESLSWWWNQFRIYFNYPAGLLGPLATIGLFVSLYGIACWCFDKTRLKQAAILLFPIFVLGCLMVAHKYPMTAGNSIHFSRLALFTLPIAYILMAAGFLNLCKHLPTPHIIGGLIAITLAVAQPYNRITDSYVRYHDMRSVAEHIAENYKTDDIIYVDYSSVPAYRFYNRLWSLPYLEGSQTKSPAWYTEMESIMEPGDQRIWVPLAVGRGKRKSAYRKFLSENYAPAIVHEFRWAWLVLSDPGKN